MASDLAPGSSPADLIPQQGMSPTQTLDGEQHGPDYARMVPQQLREEEQRLQASLMVPNGVPPRAEVLGPSEGTSDDQRRDQPGARRHEGDREVRFMTGGSENVMMRDFPQGGTGPAASVHESTASGRDGTLYDDAGAALFDRFQPSPLPGQSPAAAGQTGNSRAPTWFTRLWGLYPKESGSDFLGFSTTCEPSAPWAGMVTCRKRHDGDSILSDASSYWFGQSNS